MKDEDKLLCGWLVLDKPKGISSNLAISKLKKILGKKVKVGHAGTLDPLAEGVLPVAIGEATKTTQYMMNAEKEYYFDISWGEERSTYDAEGEVTASGGVVPILQDLENILKNFIGEIEQVPPIYSALKINGSPAYKLAREGVEFNLKSRKILIKELELVSHEPLNKISRLRVLCGKGTYVRSLAIDIARSLATFGYVSYLKRTKVGSFLIKDAKVLDNLDKIVHNMLPITFGLGDILVLEVTNEQAQKIKNGVRLELNSYLNKSLPVVQIRSNDKLQAVAQIKEGICIPIRIFNL